MGASCEAAIVGRAHRLNTVEDRLETQGGARSSSGGFPITERWCGGRGAGAARPPDPMKGPLAMEGIPDQHPAGTFTGSCKRWSRCRSPLPIRPKPLDGGRAVKMQPPRRGMKRTGSGRHDRDVRGSIDSAPWEKHAHAHANGPRGTEAEMTCPRSVRRSGLDDVNRPVPRLTARSLRLRGVFQRRKPRERAGNVRGAGKRFS